jgi:hypothetical protein
MILRRLLVGGPCVCLVLALSPAVAHAATHGQARPGTGTLRVVVSGLPRGIRANVVVIGPHARRFVLTRSTLLSSLSPGPYRVQVRQIALQHSQSGLPAGSVIEPRAASVIGTTVGAGRITTVVARYGTIRSATCNLDLNADLADGPVRGPINANDGTSFPIAGPGGALSPLYSCATDTGPAGANGPAVPAGPAEPAGPETIPAPALGIPTIIGSAQQGQALTATPGLVTGGGPSATAYQWQRDVGGSWSDIAGATGLTYSPTSSDDGDALRVVETATNSAGASTANSAPTAPVPTEDEQAEAVAVEAAHDADTWGASNGGSYLGLSLADLRTIDAAIPVGLPAAGPYIPESNGVLGTARGYTVTAVSTNGDTFSVVRSPGGALIYSCTDNAGSVGGSCASGSWTPAGP